MNKAMPKRTFDQMGRETDRRTGKLLEAQFDALFEDPTRGLTRMTSNILLLKETMKLIV